MSVEAGRYGPDAPVPIFQWEQEFSKLLEIYKQRKPNRVLEIGTYHGGTLYHWLRNAPSGAHVVSIDSYEAGIDNRHLYQEWCPPGVTVQAIEGRSEGYLTYVKAMRSGPYDWIWIDAGHKYHEVKHDWEFYGPLCNPGGVVCFHDILPPTKAWPEIEVNRLWNEIKEANPTLMTEEIIHDPKADWGGIGVVYV